MISGRPTIGYQKQADGAEVAAIPFAYAQGAPDLEFIVYLPAENANFSEAQKKFFHQSFLTKVLSQTDSTLSYQKAKLTMPKFSFDTSVEMKKNDELTHAIGLDFLFANTADFSAMATNASVDTKVGLIKHNSRIELDEKGVKAAAVTIVGGIERTSMPQGPTINMVLNRPFMFTIIEKSTQAILFTETVVDPRESFFSRIRVPYGALLFCHFEYQKLNIVLLFARPLFGISW
jgi:serine protease inhibitor